MNFGEYIQLSLSTDVWEERQEEVRDLAHERIARSVQRSLRGKLDFGLDPKAAAKAQAVRVAAKGNRLVISTEDPGETLGRSAPGRGDKDPGEGILDLFEPSSGIPRAVTDAFGNRKLVYRTVDPSRLFETEQRKERAGVVEQTVVDTVRNEIGQAYSDAIDEVQRRYPGER